MAVVVMQELLLLCTSLTLNIRSGRPPKLHTRQQRVYNDEAVRCICLLFSAALRLSNVIWESLLLGSHRSLWLYSTLPVTGGCEGGVWLEACAQLYIRPRYQLRFISVSYELQEY